MAGRPANAVKTSITTAVSSWSSLILHPHERWRQTVLRLADTIAGWLSGWRRAWIGLREAQWRAGAGPWWLIA